MELEPLQPVLEEHLNPGKIQELKKPIDTSDQDQDVNFFLGKPSGIDMPHTMKTEEQSVHLGDVDRQPDVKRSSVCRVIDFRSQISKDGITELTINMQELEMEHDDIVDVLEHIQFDENFEMRQTDKTSKSDNGVEGLFGKKPGSKDMLQSMKTEEQFSQKGSVDLNPEFKRSSVCRVIDFRDGVEELIGDLQEVGMQSDDIFDALENIMCDKNSEMISSWYEEDELDTCTRTTCSTSNERSSNPNKSKFRVAQRTVYFLTLLKGKSSKRTDCVPNEVDTMVKETACQSMSGVRNTAWQVKKVVTISLRKTRKYMQNLPGGLSFDELVSEVPDQTLMDFHNCHFIEEIKREKRQSGTNQLLKRYKCEETNRYMCVKKDGCIDSDDVGTVFVTKPARGRAFFTIQDKETSRHLSVEDQAKFVKPKVKEDIERLPDCFKMIITRVNGHTKF